MHKHGCTQWQPRSAYFYFSSYIRVNALATVPNSWLRLCFNNSSGHVLHCNVGLYPYGFLLHLSGTLNNMIRCSKSTRFQVIICLKRFSTPRDPTPATVSRLLHNSFISFKSIVRRTWKAAFIHHYIIHFTAITSYPNTRPPHQNGQITTLLCKSPMKLAKNGVFKLIIF